MRAYVATTGILFALIIVAHVMRVAFEGVKVLQDPLFELFTVVFAALAGWAWRLLRVPS